MSHIYNLLIFILASKNKTIPEMKKQNMYLFYSVF
jgi:hypothetical protein